MGGTCVNWEKKDTNIKQRKLVVYDQLQKWAMHVLIRLIYICQIDKFA
jgi:hypothetical protein